MVDKYSSGVPFNGELYNPGSEEEQLQKLREKIDLIAQAFSDVIPLLVDVVIENITYIWEEILKTHPNRHAVHLAFYHKSERVRKKNRARIAKDFSRLVNSDV